MKKLLFISIVSVFFLLPFENARVLVFGIPIYFVEIGVVFSAFLLLFPLSQKKFHTWLREKNLRRGDQTQTNSNESFFGWLFLSLTQKLTYQASERFFERATCEISFGVFTGISILLLGILSSILVAVFSQSAVCPLSHEGLFRALGIFKSWFVFPILFGYILFRASRYHFSIEKLIFVFTISFLPISILSSLGWIFGSGMTYDGRLEGIFNSPNALAMYLTPVAILSWYFFRTHPSRFPFIIYNLSSIILLFLTRSYSAWIAVSLALFFFEAMGNRVSLKRFAALFGIFLMLSCLVTLSQKDSPRFAQFFSPDSRSSFASRVMIWKSAEKMIADSPLFGIGPGNFQSCYLAYQRYFPPYLEWSAPEPHNIFLAFWLESGLLGLLAFCFLIGWWFQTLFLALKTTKKERQQTLLALMAIMIAIIIHGFFDTPYWRLSLAYIFWIVFFLGILREPQ